MWIMKRISLIIILVTSSIVLAQAKWTLVPRYSSYVSISQQSDTVDYRSINTTLYRNDTLGMFRVAIVHETLTKQKAKYLRWRPGYSFMASYRDMTNTATDFDEMQDEEFQGSLRDYVRGTLAEIYDKNKGNGKQLAIEAWIENTCQEELMIADERTGKVWFLRPGQAMGQKLRNPDVRMLRISTLNHNRLHYVTIAGGSFMRDVNVAYEDDACWIFPMEAPNEEGILQTEAYFVFSKATAEQQRITIEEFKEIKKRK